MRSQLSRGQPVSPDQSAMLMQDFARGAVEAKMFVDRHGAFHISLGVPADCISSDGMVENVPIVFRYYTETHACAAVCKSLTANGSKKAYQESWDILGNTYLISKDIFRSNGMRLSRWKRC